MDISARLLAQNIEHEATLNHQHRDFIADREAGTVPRHIVKEDGETGIEGLTATGVFADD